MIRWGSSVSVFLEVRLGNVLALEHEGLSGVACRYVEVSKVVHHIYIVVKSQSSSTVSTLSLTTMAGEAPHACSLPTA
jgi:hypothetical protein